METVRDWGPTGPDIDYGAGRLDAYAAVQAAGGGPGRNIEVPAHHYAAGSLAKRGATAWHNLEVTDASLPIAVTLVMPEWIRHNSPDFDLELYRGDTLLAYSRGTTRQETVAYSPPAEATGTYRVRVSSYLGSGPYFFDASSGSPKETGVTLNTGDVWEAGVVTVGGTADHTAQFRVTGGPADLYLGAAAFSDGSVSWAYGDEPGADRARLAYSLDGSTWRTVREANALHYLAMNVPKDEECDVFFRLTLPTMSTSSEVFHTNIQIVAVAP
jgi:hypothetical protein